MKLLDQVRQKLRAGHYAYHTEQSLCPLDRALHSLVCRYPQEMAASSAQKFFAIGVYHSGSCYGACL